jgi:hypothetical protein
MSKQLIVDVLIKRRPKSQIGPLCMGRFQVSLLSFICFRLTIYIFMMFQIGTKILSKHNLTTFVSDLNWAKKKLFKSQHITLNSLYSDFKRERYDDLFHLFDHEMSYLLLRFDLTYLLMV